MLDIPCGDYNWMQLVDKGGIKYLGGDISSRVIEHNKKYADKNTKFQIIDVTKDKLPKVDLIFCKDCLQHISEAGVKTALRNIKNSGSKYLVVTSYPLTLKNWDIKNGDYRPLNLHAAPFNMKNYIDFFQEQPGEKYVKPDKFMFLYKIKDLPDF